MQLWCHLAINISKAKRVRTEERGPWRWQREQQRTSSSSSDDEHHHHKQKPAGGQLVDGCAVVDGKFLYRFSNRTLVHSDWAQITGLSSLMKFALASPLFEKSAQVSLTVENPESRNF
jgi:hypothetical protein